jgi:hypothetical protein
VALMVGLALRADALAQGSGSPPAEPSTALTGVGAFSLRVPPEWTRFNAPELAALRSRFEEESAGIYRKFANAPDPTKAVDVRAFRLPNDEGSFVTVSYALPDRTDVIESLKGEAKEKMAFGIREGYIRKFIGLEPFDGPPFSGFYVVAIGNDGAVQISGGLQHRQYNDSLLQLTLLCPRSWDDARAVSTMSGLLRTVQLRPSRAEPLSPPETVAEPGGTVTISAGQVAALQWLGRPKWKAATVTVTPRPFVTPTGEVIEWTATEASANHSEDLNIEGDSFDAADGRPVQRNRDVTVAFTLNDDDRLLGATLTGSVRIVVRHQVADGRSTSMHTTPVGRDFVFRVATAEERRAARSGTLRLVVLAAVGIALLLAGAALVMRSRAKPKGVMRQLNDWRSAQASRLGASTVICPSCDVAVAVAPTCSACGKVLLRARTISRALLLAIPALFVVMIGYLLSNASGIYWITQNIAATGAGGVIVIMVLLSIFRSAFSDMSQGVGGLASAILLPSSPREKLVRLANRIAEKKTIGDEEKARAYGLALCQPFFDLSEFHIAADRTCGVSFWTKNHASPSIAETTRAVLADLVFVENLQLCLSSNSYVPAKDARVDAMAAAASDSPFLLDVAQVIRAEAGTNEWLKGLITHMLGKTEGKAPNLAASLLSPAAT